MIPDDIPDDLDGSILGEILKPFLAGGGEVHIAPTIGVDFVKPWVIQL